MACAISHLRFGLDIMSELRVVDESKYVLGLCYPDSRHITRIDRGITHSDKYINFEFYSGDDFKKGIAAHVIYDIVHNKTMDEVLDYLFDYKMFSRFFVDYNRGNIRMAVKVIQNILDSKVCDYRKYINNLAYYEFTPNNEDIGLLNEYNDILKKAFLEFDELNKDSYKEVLKLLGVGSFKRNKVLAIVDKFWNDDKIIKDIKALYNESVELYYFKYKLKI